MLQRRHIWRDRQFLSAYSITMLGVPLILNWEILGYLEVKPGRLGLGNGRMSARYHAKQPFNPRELISVIWSSVLILTDF